MTLHDYKEQIKNDILENAKYYKDSISDLEELSEQMWTDDSITGNGSGTYFDSEDKAREAIGPLIWSNDLLDIFKEYGYDRVPMEKGARFIDTSIRCFLLNECIYELEPELKKILGL